VYKELFVEHAATGNGEGYQSVGGKEATRQLVSSIGLHGGV
jgi:hypothetical protein